MSKIAVFYMIGQYGEESYWKQFYTEQLALLDQSGLSDKMQLIEVFVKGAKPIPQIELPDKTNMVTYIGGREEDRSTNRELYRAYTYIQQRIWNFSNANPEYKILLFHSLGISHKEEKVIKRSNDFRQYLETICIRYWRECVELLNYYDCVGTDLDPKAVLRQPIVLDAPHYPGIFWWANASYLKKLNPCYFYQDVEWQPYLGELWIGSGNPNYYNFYNTYRNRYFDDFDPIPYEMIISNTQNHLMNLQK